MSHAIIVHVLHQRPPSKYATWPLGCTLFYKPHFARRTLLPQAKTVAALGTSDGGVLRGDPAFAPGHSLHLPLLLLVREGTLPLLALRRCKETQESIQILSQTRPGFAGTTKWMKYLNYGSTFNSNMKAVRHTGWGERVSDDLTASLIYAVSSHFFIDT